MPERFPVQGRCRVVIENVTPQIDGGRHPVKRTVGERLAVEADIFADGHDVLSAVVKYRAENSDQWLESPMERVANDRWRGDFAVGAEGFYFYTIEAWVDRFQSWRDDLQKKIQAGQEVGMDLRE